VSTVPEPSNPVPSQGPYSAQYLPSEASYQPSSQPTNLQAPPPDYDVGTFLGDHTKGYTYGTTSCQSPCCLIIVCHKAMYCNACIVAR